MKNLFDFIGLLAALPAACLVAQDRPKDSPAGGAGNVGPAGMRLEWTHFIGGSGADMLGMLRAPVLDRDGMLYLAGQTQSSDFPTTADALYPTFLGGSEQWGRVDLFLLKFDTRQPGIVYSTFLGGAKGPELNFDFNVDPVRNITITGNTGSADYPTTGDALVRQFQGPEGGRHGDGFFTLLGDDGRTLRYSTFIGGPKGGETVSRVFAERAGEFILFGRAQSLDFLPADVIQPNGPKKDSGAFVMKLDAKGQRIVSARVLETGWVESGRTLDTGDFLIVGNTADPEVPTTEGAFARTNHGGKVGNGGDLYITRLSADLKTVQFATLFGGTGDETGAQIAAVTGGDFFVLGFTTSKDLPVTVDAIEKTLEGPQGLFLARFSGDGRQLKYCTYLGAKGPDPVSDTPTLVYDGRSRIYVAGNTKSPGFPVTPDALQAKPRGRQDVFFLAFNIANNSLAYGSYLGGAKDEINPRLAFGEDGTIYVIGTTRSDDFPTLEKAAAPRKGSDVFISKFSIGVTAAASMAKSPQGNIK